MTQANEEEKLFKLQEWGYGCCREDAYTIAIYKCTEAKIKSYVDKYNDLVEKQIPELYSDGDYFEDLYFEGLYSYEEYNEPEIKEFNLEEPKIQYIVTIILENKMMFVDVNIWEGDSDGLKFNGDTKVEAMIKAEQYLLDNKYNIADFDVSDWSIDGDS